MDNNKRDMISEYLEHFINVRYRWVSDLPAHKINPFDERYLEYKCRGNCFVGVQSRISRLIRKGIIKDPDTEEEGRGFMVLVKGMNFNDFLVKEDIDELDRVLDLMIDYLSKIKNPQG
ncbi:hypothetical protein ACFL2R_02305 [Patescibacteria group bacterium]